MKIVSIDIIHVKPRYSFLKISTDEGLFGYGEAILEGRSRTVEMAVKELEPHLIGEDPRRIEHLWQAMYRGTFYRGGPILSSAISGIEQALWDILGKSLGVPVYQLLGGAVRDRIRIYTHIRGSSPEEVYADAKRAVKEGFTMVKWGPVGAAHVLESPAFIRKQIECVEALRDGLGPDLELALDFHGRYSPMAAVQLLSELERYQLVFVEEPVLPQNVDALLYVRNSTRIPIATGERLYTKWDFRQVIEKQAAHVLQPDLAHCGGIMEGKKIAAMAEAYYMAFAPHNPLGPINLAASLQLSANVPNFFAQEQVTLGEGYLKQPFVQKNGYIELPKGPGLGIEIDEDAIAEMRYAGDWDTPRLFHKDDGSVADW